MSDNFTGTNTTGTGITPTTGAHQQHTGTGEHRHADSSVPHPSSGIPQRDEFPGAGAPSTGLGDRPPQSGTTGLHQSSTTGHGGENPLTPHSSTTGVPTSGVGHESSSNTGLGHSASNTGAGHSSNTGGLGSSNTGLGHFSSNTSGLGHTSSNTSLGHSNTGLDHTSSHGPTSTSNTHTSSTHPTSSQTSSTTGVNDAHTTAGLGNSHATPVGTQDANTGGTGAASGEAVIDDGSKDESYLPEQRHAGAVGLGPNYRTDATMGEKLTGLKEEAKGKLTGNHELAQTGHERRTGELKKKEREQDMKSDPFHNEEEKKDEREVQDNVKTI